MAEIAGYTLLAAVSAIALLTLSACMDVRNVMDYGVCSVRHQGCGQ